MKPTLYNSTDVKDIFSILEKQNQIINIKEEENKQISFISNISFDSSFEKDMKSLDFFCCGGGINSEGLFEEVYQKMDLTPLF